MFLPLGPVRCISIVFFVFFMSLSLSVCVSVCVNRKDCRGEARFLFIDFRVSPPSVRMNITDPQVRPMREEAQQCKT